MSDATFRVSPPNSEAAARSDRLLKAVRGAGGYKAVAARAGVPEGTLGGYLSGRVQWKALTALALARACGVALEWLLTGEGDEKRQPPRATPAGDPTGKPLFSFVDVDLMARALETVAQIQQTAGSNPGSRRTVQALLLVYDSLVEETRNAGASDKT